MTSALTDKDTSGKQPCGEPLIDEATGHELGTCSIPIWPTHMPHSRWRPGKTGHPGEPHALTWRSR